MKTKLLNLKTFLVIFLFLIIYSCVNSQGKTQERNQIIHAEYTTYEEYSGKTVKSINYYKDRNPYTMTIIFTDGSILNICANKYVLDVQKKIMKIWKKLN